MSMNPQLIVGISFLLLSLFLLVKKLEAKQLIKSAKSWQKVNCKIIESSAQKVINTGTRWNYNVIYKYEVNGESFSGYVATFYTISSEEEAKKLEGLFPKGSIREAFYNLTKPSQSTLLIDNGNRSENGEVMFCVVMVSISVVVILTVWL